MSGRKPLSLVERGGTFVIRGDAYALLKAGKFRGIYNGVARGWVLDTKRLPDVTAYLESRRIPYTFTWAGDAG